MMLNGVRVFNNDANIPLHAKWSEKCLIHGKKNILQRDIVINLEDCDKNGTFFGNIMMNKKNYAVELLE